MMLKIIFRKTPAHLWKLLACCLISGAAAEPIRLHPSNGHYFLFREKPVVLVGSTEHYGSVVNLDFDYIRYLDETRACGLNLTRIFSGSYLGYPGAFEITDSVLSPPPGHSVVPWKRSTVPGAADGGNKYDLTQWDPAFFHRLRDFVREASKRGIAVELTLFSSYYFDNDPEIWAHSPMNGANHINGVGSSGAVEAYNPEGDLLPFQKALARKCVNETKEFDNVIYEIANEPYFDLISNEWQALITDEVVDAESDLPIPHLIAQNFANDDAVITSPDPRVSIFNFHYAKPNAVTWNYQFNRAIGDDETGFAGSGDLVYRTEAWEFMLAGGSLFDHLDYSFTIHREDGLAPLGGPGGGGPGIRHHLGILRWFLEGLPLVDLVPQPNFVASGVPTEGVATAIGAPGVAYGLYLRGGSQANLVVNLPAGTYRGEWIDPRSGLVSAAVAEFTHGGGTQTLASPTYGEDIALRIFGGTLPPPSVAITSPVYNRIIDSTTGALTLSAEASVVGGALLGVEFLDGEISLGTVTTPPYDLVVPTASKGKHVYRARAIATDGRTAISQAVKAIFVGPFHWGVNLNGGDSLLIDGHLLLSESDAVTAGLVITNTQPISTVGSLVRYPSPDVATTILLGDQLLRADGTGNAVIGLQHGLTNGFYDVFLFVSEDQQGYSRDMRLILEGQIAARGIGFLANGDWQKYGPYRIEVTDGVMDVGVQQETLGVPKIAGLSVYQADPPPDFSDNSLSIGRSEGLLFLSYPSGLSAAKVETSTDLGNADAWSELTSPAALFSDRNLIAVPEDDPARFYRLRSQ
jgi:hypothetical protein